ncbi:plastocyanin/azurin family copper-binding protein [Rubrolithibacter danxiaensis]|uniref:plastocyanin/azurin family copper-binding protein n=1 Tax=Rubrolithibacter danxiaensis TaxID=3390805 RepID=UPI003BF7AD28
MREVLIRSIFLFLSGVTLIFNSCNSSSSKPAVHTVEIKDMKFTPANLTVNKGDTVVWINRDMMAHDITEADTKAWTSGPIAEGESWKMAVTENSNYYCSIHSVMKGKLILK